MPTETTAQTHTHKANKSVTFKYDEIVKLQLAASPALVKRRKLPNKYELAHLHIDWNAIKELQDNCENAANRRYNVRANTFDDKTIAVPTAKNVGDYPETTLLASDTYTEPTVTLSPVSESSLYKRRSDRMKLRQSNTF